MPNKKNNAQRTHKLGAFSGVFVPSLLGILGLILFLRLGWVVGQVGVSGALVIITISTAIAAITALSLSAIATNMPVGAGGIYYMISRSLGLQIGAAIGIPLYLSQAMSVAFFTIGFSEALSSVAPYFDQRIVSTIVVATFTILVYIGADFALKFKFIAMVIVALAIGSIFLGTPMDGASGLSLDFPGFSHDFWMVFAVFFPAMKGISIGVSLSGDLKNPARSIPRGAFGAIGVSFVIYCAVAIWLGYSAPVEKLVSDDNIILSIAVWPWLALAGVFGGALASALGSMLAAPRTLQALSRDRVTPKIFQSKMGASKEPRAAILATSVIALSVIWMGDLNFTAKLISMFFLNTFAMLNMTAGLELLVGNPSFRPTIKAPPIIPLLGAVGCYGAMVLINLWATVVAIVVSYGVFLILERREVEQRWGDLRQGIWLELAQFVLAKIDSFPSGVKNWRPNLVVFSGFTSKYQHLLQMGDWFSKGRGIVTFYHLIIGDFTKMPSGKLRNSAQKRLLEDMKSLECDCFVESSIVREFNEGALQALQAHGISGLAPNTAMMALETDTDKLREQIKLIDNIVILGKSVALLHVDQDQGFRARNRIDVWWTKSVREREMILLMAHILKRSSDWRDSSIRVLRIVKDRQSAEQASQGLQKWIADARVEASPHIIIRKGPAEFFSREFKEESQSSDLVIMALEFNDRQSIDDRQSHISKLIQWIDAPLLLIKSGEDKDVLTGERKEQNARIV